MNSYCNIHSRSISNLTSYMTLYSVCHAYNVTIQVLCTSVLIMHPVVIRRVICTGVILSSSIVLLSKDVHINHFISLPQFVLACYNREHDEAQQSNDCDHCVTDCSTAANSAVEIHAWKQLN